MDFVLVARELVRALRGKRSQTALSRRLGYRTNVIYRWEAGRDFPSAAKFLHLAERTGRDVRGAIEQFYRVAPGWLAEHSPGSRDGAAAFLRDLQGPTSIVELAAATGHSRFKVARWLQGKGEPRLPEFLQLIVASSLRMLDFVATLVDPTRLPSLHEPWRDL
jgi:transcriptional regulator with XRE-family HTH domain